MIEQSAGAAARFEHVRSLSTLGEQAIPALMELLSEPEWSLRREVIAALSRLGSAAVPALVACLEHERGDETRIAACVDALVGAAGEAADHALILLAERACPAVLADIAQILGRRRSSVANDLLRNLTQHGDDNVAVSAIEALGKLGGRAAVDALIACVLSKNFYRTHPAIDVLGRSGDPRAVEPLAELLRDPRYTLEAARALGRTADRRAVLPLAALLSSRSDANVRVASLALIELRDRQRQLYGASSSVEKELLQLGSEAIARRIAQSASGADTREKVAACQLLAELRAESVTPMLLSFLDLEREVSAAAASALAQITKASDHALWHALSDGSAARRLALLPVVRSRSGLSALVACMSDANVEVRVAACEAAARTGSVAAVPALFALLADEQQRVVHAAVAAIQALGSDRTEALALEAASSTRPSTRLAGLRVLAYFGFASALPLFAAAASDADPRMVDTALQGLALLEQPEARSYLARAASEKRANVRAAAMRAMGQLTDEQWQREHLLLGLRDEDAWVRYYACQALGKLGSQSVAEELRALLADGAGQVRVAAVEALSHSRSPGTHEILLELAAHDDLDMRRAALLGLGLRGDPASIPLLATMVDAEEPATRLVALSALASFSAAQVVPLLRKGTEDAVEAVRTAALNLLAERTDRDAADALVSLLDRVEDRSLLASALTAPHEAKVAALEAALAQADDDRAAWLLSCLSRSRAESATRALYRTLTSSNPAARKALISALSALGTQEARSAIQQLSLHDPDPGVRLTCSLCLAS